MSGSGHLREGDGDSMLALLEDARHDDAGRVMPWIVLEDLQRLIPCDFAVNYMEIQVVHGRTLFLQETDLDGGRFLWDWTSLDAAEIAEQKAEDSRLFWQLWWADPLCSYRQRTGDQRSVVHTGDFFPVMRDLKSRPLTNELAAEFTSVMIVPLPAAPACERRVVFARAKDRAFDERDRQVAALLRPHLQEIWLDAQRRHAGVPRLTPREWEILAMTGAGLSYAQIADRLFISVSTVRKHMEHVRGRLGVQSAAAAAALALPHAPQRRR